MFSADFEANPGIRCDRSQVVVEYLEPNFAQSHVVEGFFRHEACRLSAIPFAPDILLSDDDAKKRRNPIPAGEAVSERGRANEALALALMDREAGAACRGWQNKCFEIAAR